MNRILGLDVGTNSLGWAILDLEKQTFTDAGTIVFQQGVPEEKGKEAELSPAAERRLQRAARRLKFRRRLRKYHALKLLIANGMCPLSMPELSGWIQNGKFPIGNKRFIAWLCSTKESNPYYFRAKAAEEKLPPLELGRAFYHLAIRRGFKSSRKESASSSDDKERSQMKKEIRNLTEILQEKRCTLGQYFYELFRNQEKIRKVNRCGRKEHYEPEFERICAVQNLPESFVADMRKALFMQRPLRSQKHLAGHCSLEKKHVRCLAGHPMFERYRMLAFLNSVRKNGAPLCEEERRKAQTAFFLEKRSFSFERIVKKLNPKNWENALAEYNYPRDKSIAAATVTHQLQKVLGTKDLFSWRREYAAADGSRKVMDYQTIFDALTFFDDDDRLKRFAMERVGLSPEQAEDFAKIKIPSGYASFSLCAIRKIVPFLEAGHVQTRAVFLANLPTVLGEEVFRKNAARILADMERIEAEWRADRDAAAFGGGHAAFQSQTERMKQYLEDEFHVTPDRFEMLYRYNGRSDYPDNSETGVLPAVNLGMIYNPVVHRSLTVLRRLVNHLRKTGKIDADTEIHVELARSVNDKNTRAAIANRQKEREKLRMECKAKIEEQGWKATDEMILRYALWMEQKELCLYTGKKIGLADLLNSDNVVEIEHTIPRSRGGDSRMENLTLCFTEYNRHVKKNALPTMCPDYDSILDNIKAVDWEGKLETLRKKVENLRTAARGNPKKRIEMLQSRMEYDYWRAKLDAFRISDGELRSQGFSPRQLADTGVIARHAVFLLKSVYKKTYSRSGRATDWVRKAWGVQGMYERKDRKDHKHHAVDAMCVAAMTGGFYQRIAEAFREDEERAMKLPQTLRSLPNAYPWPTFPDDVLEKSKEILVVHCVRRNETKQTRKKVHLVTPYRSANGEVRRVAISGGDVVRGQLHKETHYGCIRESKSGEEKFVARKELILGNFEKETDLDSIVDPAVRDAVQSQIRARMNRDGKTFKDAMNEGAFRMKSKDGSFSGPPILKVRCFARPDALLKIRKQTYPSKAECKRFAYAETAKGGNFRAALFRSPQGRLVYRLQSLWEWATTHKNADYVPPEKRQGEGEFLGFIAPGTMALTYENSPEELKSLPPSELGRRLYKITEIKKDLRLCLRWHCEARAKRDAQADMKTRTGVEEASSISFKTPANLLMIGSKEYSRHLIFEGIDFAFSIDGKIRFLK